MDRGLFDELETPNTEGIKYIGSKLKLLPYILEDIRGLKIKTVLDGFSGSTRVSQAFSQIGLDVTANDVSEWSEVFGNCYLKSTKSDAYYQRILDTLNKLPGYDGWFTQYYGGDDALGKKPFQVHNTRKLDAIRDKIDELGLEWVDKCVILTSLILAMDSVDNTLGHFVSYLSGWSTRSYNTMIMRLPKRFPVKTNNRVVKGDIFELFHTGPSYDLAYFDPPYGSNNEKMPPSRVRYASYYHLWKTIVLNDHPVLFGKANRRNDTHDTEAASIFEEYKKNNDGKFIAMQAIDKMIKEVPANYILLSYSSGGRATKEELFDIISTYGYLVSAHEIDYKKNVMAGFSWTNEWVTNTSTDHKEYLFLMQKKGIS